MNDANGGRAIAGASPPGRLPRLCAAALCVLLAVFGSRSAWSVTWDRGVKVGINAATFRGDLGELIGAERRIGFVGGVFVTCRVSPRFGLQSELLYAMKGSKDSFDATNPSGSNIGQGHDHWILKYIEVPVLARVSLAPSARVRPEVCLGPSLGFKLDGTFKSEAPGYPTTSIDISQLETFDFGLAAGIGFSVGRGPYRGLLDLRYTRGLSSVFQSGPGSLEARNSTFTLMAGISY